MIVGGQGGVLQCQKLYLEVSILDCERIVLIFCVARWDNGGVPEDGPSGAYTSATSILYDNNQ